MFLPLFLESSKFSDWFKIDATSGEISTQTSLDCELESNPRVIIVARDNGEPALSSTATLSIRIEDVNDNKPLFESSYYETKLSEDIPSGQCFLRVKATDSDCGKNGEISYQLEEHKDVFRIQDDGNLCLKGKVDRESRDAYSLMAVAVDKGGLSASTLISINILDVNDNAPLFSPSSYKVHLGRDHSKSDSPILTVKAMDNDLGENGRIRYEISAGNSENLFSLNPTSGSLYFTGSRRLNQPSYTLFIDAVDGAGKISGNQAQVEIMVGEDSLETYQYRFVIPEDISPYSEVGKISVPGAEEFAVIGSSNEAYFTINPSTGVVRTESRLDYERHPLVIANIRFRKDGTVHYVQAIVELTDVNDNAPEFVSRRAIASVPENYPTGKVIYVCKATDPDSGDDGKMTYSIKKNSGDDLFAVDSFSGAVSLAKSLDFETANEHKLIVEASDNGRPQLTSTMKLTINVHDVNDNPPEFSRPKYSFSISKNLALNSPIGLVKATDKDERKNGRITYAIDDANFGIFPNSGTIFLKQKLVTSRQQATFRVIAKDQGVPSLKSYADVLILFADKNDLSPVFKEDSYKFSIEENAVIGSLVGIVQATDDDFGANGEVKYRIRTPIETFSVDPESGTIMTQDALDRETNDEYELVIEAVDQGSPSRSAQVVVKIVVEDVNDEAPILTSPSSKMIYVKSGGQSGSFVGKIAGEDKDLNDRIAYEIVGGSGSTYFMLDKWSGDLRLTRTIANVESLDLKIAMTDTASNQAKVDIFVAVVNDEINTIKTSRNFEIVVDKSSAGTKVGSLAPLLSNTEAQSSLFKLVPDDQFPFYVDPLNGNVFSLSDNIPSEAAFMAKVSLESITGKRPPSTIELKIRKSKSDNEQLFKDPTYIEIAEDMPIGTEVHKINFVQDQGLKFELFDQVPSKSFDVEETGSITLVKPLDYERDKTHVMTVRVVSKSSESGSTLLTVIVNVLDVNDNKPEILTQSTLDVFSDTPLNKALMTVFAADDDSGDAGDVKYSITDGNYDGAFALDYNSGILKLIRPPTSSSYSLSIRAEDNGGSVKLSDQQDLQVSVKRRDSDRPIFSKTEFNAEIKENLPAGQEVTVLSTNLRSLSNNKFDLMIESDMFAIDPYTGLISTKLPLDREESSFHLLVVGLKSQESGEPTDTAMVNVTVVDVNDNDPTFSNSCKDLQVPENLEEKLLHTITAFDKDSDENGRLTYTLQDTLNAFRMDSETGALFASVLDRETRSSYDLVAIVTDNGESRRTAKCEFTITVTDVNDNDPVFSQYIYSTSVKEDLPIGTEVLRVSATDPDYGANAKIRYSIENSTNWSFAIDDETGSIFTVAELDRESIAEYDFDVRATDEGQDIARSTTARVTIIVTDANDHTPQFDKFPFRINISATPPVGVPLLRLSASDRDNGPRAQLSYNLINKRSKYQLSPDQGILTVGGQDSLWEPGTVEYLEVTVSDAGRPPKSSTGLIEVVIEGGPAIKLSFDKDLYTAEIFENPASGTDVAEVQAFRSDGRRQRVIYTFVKGNELGAFEINSNNGLIRVRDPEMLDYELQKEFILTIAGEGLGEDNLNAYTTCVVTIKNINDNPPRFSQEAYYADVTEGLAKESPVLKVAAFDLDLETTDFLYEIIDGNVDGAFTTKTASPGIIFTNTVLDREIRDSYELTVSATDGGVPPLVGVAKVHVRVLDVNDSPLQFPALPQIKLSRDTPPGSYVGTVRANDIDALKNIEYSVNDEKFSIEKFTGQVFLRSKLDKIEEISVDIQATDGKHKTVGQLKISVEENRQTCVPKFSSFLYNFEVLNNATYPTSIGQVEAQDCGIPDNLQINIEDNDHLYLASNGSIIAITEMQDSTTTSIIKVRDKRSRKSSYAVVVVRKTDRYELPLEFVEFPNEGIQYGSDNRTLGLVQANQDQVIFEIQENDYIKIDAQTGVIYGVKTTPSESLPDTLQVSARKSRGNGGEISKSVQVYSLHQVPLAFVTTDVERTLDISDPIGTRVAICPLNQQGLSKPNYQIISGNEKNAFGLENDQLVLKKRLSNLNMKMLHVVIRIGTPNDVSVCLVSVRVEGEAKASNSKKSSIFSLPKMVALVPENSPVGSFVAIPPTKDQREVSFRTDSKQFSVNSETGQIRTLVPLDYEGVKTYHLRLLANDSSGQLSIMNVQILVESLDEFSPNFENRNYNFSLLRISYPGNIIGQVNARDLDEGPDGYVTYGFAQTNPYFSIDPDRGAIVLKTALDYGAFEESPNSNPDLGIINLKVTAKSNMPSSLSAVADVEIVVEPSLLPVILQPRGGVPSWLQGVLVGLFLVILCLAIALGLHCKKRMDKAKQSQLLHDESKISTNRNSGAPLGDPYLELAAKQSGFPPPQYSEIASDHYGGSSSSGPGAVKMHMRSELSEKSHRSASSGRGSVEDEEDADVEIRMINEGSYLSPTGSSNYATATHVEEDKLSEDAGSVHNTEEYLARLGIDVRKPPNVNMHSDHYNSGSIYNRIPGDTLSDKNSILSGIKPGIYGSNAQPSMTGSLSSIVHSEEELTGSYNWDYLLDWGPQYQPLAHVFKEISRLRDDDYTTTTTNVNDRANNSTAARLAFRTGTQGRTAAGPRRSSPISHLMSAHSQSALSPNFHPALSPLATKSPSVSPLSVPIPKDIQKTNI